MNRFVWLGCALALLVGLISCSTDEVDAPPQLTLRIVRPDPAPERVLGKQAIDSVIAIVFDASRTAKIENIPVSARYQALVNDYFTRLENGPGDFSTFVEWRDWVSSHYDIVDEEQLLVTGGVAEGTLQAALGWNFVLVGLFSDGTLQDVGFGPAPGEPGGGEAVTIAVSLPPDFVPPGTAPLDFFFTAPSDDQIVIDDVVRLEGQLNDPFLTAGSAQVNQSGIDITVPLRLGFFAAPVPIDPGFNTIEFSVTRDRDEQFVSRAVSVDRRDPLAITALFSPVEGAVTAQATVPVSGEISDEQVDLIEVFVNGALVGQAFNEGSFFGFDQAPLGLGANTMEIVATRGSETVRRSVRLTRRDPLALNFLEIGELNDIPTDAHLGRVELAFDQFLPEPRISIDGAIPAGSSIALRWRPEQGADPMGFELFYNQQEQSIGRSSDQSVGNPSNWFQESFPIPEFVTDEFRTFIFFYAGVSEGALILDWIDLRIGDEQFRFGVEDDSPDDLDFGTIVNATGGVVGFDFRSELAAGRGSPRVSWLPAAASPGTPALSLEFELDGGLQDATTPIDPNQVSGFLTEFLFPADVFFADHRLDWRINPSNDPLAVIQVDWFRLDFQAIQR